MELVYVVSGHRAYQAAGEMLEAFPGDMVVLPDSISHMQHTFENTVTLFATIRGYQGILDDRLRSIPLGHDCAAGWMADLVASRYGPVELSQACENSLALAVMQRLHDIDQAHRPYHPAVHAALTCMRERLGDPKLSLRALAQQAGISASHLSLLFRQQLRSSPMRVLERMRMDRARQLLESPYDSVKTIAAACGYRQSSYFCRVFRSQVGQSPGEYRAAQVRP